MKSGGALEKLAITVLQKKYPRWFVKNYLQEFEKERGRKFMTGTEEENISDLMAFAADFIADRWEMLATAVKGDAEKKTG
jgi:hypothetical protein